MTSKKPPGAALPPAAPQPAAAAAAERLFPCVDPMAPLPPGARMVNLALQGGGSHGAFTWGVLDRLLEDERIVIEGISGASAGSMNAAVLAYGYGIGGREGARGLLRDFWGQVGELASFGFQPSPIDRLMGQHNLDHSPFYIGYDFMTRMMSPYQFNPLGYNPLRDILARIVDFPQLQREAKLRLYISATDVEAGQLKIFTQAEVTPDIILASACLPLIFPAVKVDERHYWDGGYMGNPPLYPLIRDCRAEDVVIVQTNAMKRPGVPMRPAAIADRLNEITFNASMMSEIRGIELINRLITDHAIVTNNCGLRKMNIHMIGDEEALAGFSASSKLNASWDFLEILQEMGRIAATRWLDAHFADLGLRSSYTAP